MYWLRRILQSSSILLLGIKYKNYWMLDKPQNTLFSQNNNVFINISNNLQKSNEGENKQNSQHKQTNHDEQKQKEKQQKEQIIQNDKNTQNNTKIHTQEEQKQQIQIVNVSKINCIENIEINSAIVSKDCPKHILNYLKTLNIKIIVVQQYQNYLLFKNKKGDVYTLNKNETNHLSNIKILKNYINPVIEINSRQQAQQLLKLQNDSQYILSYIPTSQKYEQQFRNKVKSQFDTYSLDRKIDVKKHQQQFYKRSYSLTSNKINCVIVRNKQAAQYLKINNKIGQHYHFKKPNNSSIPNYKINNQKYIINNVKKDWKQSNLQEQILYIQNEVDAWAKLQQLKIDKSNRKILLVHSKQENKQFHSKIQHILQKLARINSNKIIVIKTSNQKILKNIFKIYPNEFNTIRLINPLCNQKGIFKENSTQFIPCRSIFKNKFNVEQLNAFINSQNWQEYYQNKNDLTSIQPININQIKNNNNNNSLILIQKQGCQGCNYLKKSFSFLQQIIQQLQSTNKQYYINNYGINKQQYIKNVKLKRSSVFNQSLSFPLSTITPQLLFSLNGKIHNIEVERILQVVKKYQPKQAHERVLQNLLQQIINIKEYNNQN